MLTEPTVLFDLDEATYHADGLCPEPSLSSTMAKTILKPGGPALLRAKRDTPPEKRRVFDFGSAAHAKVLGRGQDVQIVPGNRATKKVREAVSEAEAAGFLVLKPEEGEQLDGMTEALLSHPLASELLTTGAGSPEVSMFGVDELTGRWLRGRLDFLHSRQLIVDYKTTAAADPENFANSSWRFGYHVQAAHYIELAKQLDLVDDDCGYLLIAQEKQAPYLVSVHEFDPALLDHGANQVRAAIDLWDRCLTLDDWPGLTPTIHTLTAPRWAHIEGDNQ